MLFKKIVAIYSEKHTKPVNTRREKNAAFLIVKAGGTHMYRHALKC